MPDNQNSNKKSPFKSIFGNGGNDAKSADAAADATPADDAAAAAAAAADVETADAKPAEPKPVKVSVSNVSTPLCENPFYCEAVDEKEARAKFYAANNLHSIKQTLDFAWDEKPPEDEITI